MRFEKGKSAYTIAVFVLTLILVVMLWIGYLVLSTSRIVSPFVANISQLLGPSRHANKLNVDIASERDANGH